MLALIRPPALSGQGVPIGRLLETVFMANAAMQEIQQREKHAQRHVLIDMRLFVRAQTDAFGTAIGGTIIGQHLIFQIGPGIQDHLP